MLTSEIERKGIIVLEGKHLKVFYSWHGVTGTYTRTNEGAENKKKTAIQVNSMFQYRPRPILLRLTLTVSLLFIVKN